MAEQPSQQGRQPYNYKLLAAGGLLLLMFGWLLATPPPSVRCTPATQSYLCGQQVCAHSEEEHKQRRNHNENRQGTEEEKDSAAMCAPCKHSSECSASSERCIEGKCQLRAVTRTFELSTGVALLAAVGFSAVAAVAGVGGVAVLQWAFYLFLKISLASSAALAASTAIAQCAANAFLLSREHHPEHQPPDATRPLINYTYLSFMMPPCVAGVVFGYCISSLNLYVRTALCIVVMATALWKAVVIARQQHDADVKRLFAARRSPTMVDERSPLIPNGRSPPNAIRQAGSPLFQNTDADDHGRILPLFPVFELSFLFFCLFVGMALTFMAGELGGALGRISIAIVASGIFAFMAFFSYKRLDSQRERINLGEEHYDSLPFEWNAATVLAHPPIAAAAGMCFSLLGVEPGFVLSILMAEGAKMAAPEEIAATNTIATAVTTMVVLVKGWDFVRLDYGFLFCVAGVVGAMVGRLGIAHTINVKGCFCCFPFAVALVGALSLISLCAMNLFVFVG